MWTSARVCIQTALLPRELKFLSAVDDLYYFRTFGFRIPIIYEWFGEALWQLTYTCCMLILGLEGKRVSCKIEHDSTQAYVIVLQIKRLFANPNVSSFYWDTLASLPCLKVLDIPDTSVSRWCCEVTRSTAKSAFQNCLRTIKVKLRIYNTSIVTQTEVCEIAWYGGGAWTSWNNSRCVSVSQGWIGSQKKRSTYRNPSWTKTDKKIRRGKKGGKQYFYAGH